MSLYKGNNLISGAMPNSANQSLSNLDSAGQNIIDGKVDLDLTNVNNVGYIKMAGAGMPSDTYTDLTLGASGSTYTAPADGWFTLYKDTTASQFLRLTNLTSLVYSGFVWPGAGAVYGSVPAQKGDNVEVIYDAAGTTQIFRFIYAQGSKSEAS